MKTPKFGKKAFTIAIFVVMIVLAFASMASAQSSGEGAVCPPGDVKWETDGGYEYTDNSATVSGDADQVTVSAAEGYEIVSVCIKIGGPGGGSTISEDGPGTFGPYDYGISHVVVETKKADEPLIKIYKISVGSCLVAETSEFQINVYNKSNVSADWRLLGVDGTILDLGTLDVDEHVQVSTFVETTWKKQVYLDGSWVNKGGTHVTSVAGHTQNEFFCEPPVPQVYRYEVSVGSCYEDTPEGIIYRLKFVNKSTLNGEPVGIEFKLKHTSGVEILATLGPGEILGDYSGEPSTMIAGTWTKFAKNQEGKWINAGGTHVTSTNAGMCKPPEPPEYVLQFTYDGFCEAETPYMNLEIKNLGVAALYWVKHKETGTVVMQQMLNTGESFNTVVGVFGEFQIWVFENDRFVELGTVYMDPDLECKEGGGEEEGYTVITRTPTDCPVCIGEGPLRVMEIGDKPVAWHFRNEACYIIQTNRGVGTRYEKSYTDLACDAKGTVFVVAPADMPIYGDVEGFSRSQQLTADSEFVIAGKSYKGYITNHNVYADDGDGVLTGDEKLKNNYEGPVWQYEAFCCLGFPLVEVDGELSIIKLPRICFNGVQLSLSEAGFDHNPEQMTALGEAYKNAVYFETLAVP